MIREVTPWTGQFVILFKRTMKEQWRKRSMLLTQLLQSVIIAVLIGTVFLQVRTTEWGIPVVGLGFRV
jgi:ATP-binding cassette subfamily G (WHITE) protein 2